MGLQNKLLKETARKWEFLILCVKKRDIWVNVLNVAPECEMPYLDL